MSRLRARRAARARDARALVPRAGELLSRKRIGTADLIGSTMIVPAAALTIAAGLDMMSVVGLWISAVAASAGVSRAFRAVSAARRRWLERQFHLVPLRPTLAGLPTGEIIRIRGRVVADAAFESPGSGQRAVLAAYRGTVASVRGRWARWHSELRGVRFLVALSSDERVRIDLGSVFYLDRLDPLIARRPDAPALAVRTERLPSGLTARIKVYDADIVCPGDEVEAVGLLDTEIDPTRSPAHPRAMPRAPILRATSGHPVLVRRLDPPAVAAAARG